MVGTWLQFVTIQNITCIINRPQMPSSTSQPIIPLRQRIASKHPFSPRGDIHNHDSGGSPSLLPKHPPPPLLLPALSTLATGPKIPVRSPIPEASLNKSPCEMLRCSARVRAISRNCSLQPISWKAIASVISVSHRRPTNKNSLFAAATFSTAAAKSYTSLLGRAVFPTPAPFPLLPLHCQTELLLRRVPPASSFSARSAESLCYAR
jgi:hypothetical protein